MEKNKKGKNKGTREQPAASAGDLADHPKPSEPPGSDGVQGAHSAGPSREKRQRFVPFVAPLQPQVNDGDLPTREYTVLYRPVARRSHFLAASSDAIAAFLSGVPGAHRVRPNLRRNVVAVDTLPGGDLTALLAAKALILNTCTGTLFDVDPTFDGATIFEGLESSVPVVAVARSGDAVTLRFAGDVVPEEVLLFRRRRAVRPRLPRPLQCGRCGLFGHATVTCSRDHRCLQCAGRHPTNSCTADRRRCLHCGGPHAATEPRCPQWQLERKVAASLASSKPRITRKQALQLAWSSTSAATGSSEQRPAGQLATTTRPLSAHRQPGLSYSAALTGGPRADSSISRGAGEPPPTDTNTVQPPGATTPATSVLVVTALASALRSLLELVLAVSPARHISYSVVNWPRSRELCAAVPVSEGGLFRHIAECARAATTRCVVPAGTPVPDIKQLNLQAAPQRRAFASLVGLGPSCAWLPPHPHRRRRLDIRTTLVLGLLRLCAESQPAGPVCARVFFFFFSVHACHVSLTVRALRAPRVCASRVHTALPSSPRERQPPPRVRACAVSVPRAIARPCARKYPRAMENFVSPSARAPRKGHRRSASATAPLPQSLGLELQLRYDAQARAAEICQSGTTDTAADVPAPSGEAADHLPAATPPPAALQPSDTMEPTMVELPVTSDEEDMDETTTRKRGRDSEDEEELPKQSKGLGAHSDSKRKHLTPPSTPAATYRGARRHNPAAEKTSPSAAPGQPATTTPGVAASQKTAASHEPEPRRKAPPQTAADLLKRSQRPATNVATKKQLKKTAKGKRSQPAGAPQARSSSSQGAPATPPQQAGHSQRTPEASTNLAGATRNPSQVFKVVLGYLADTMLADRL
ncbi:hypothetical protein HPB49_019727 [Dermacentor silvarum]|uniref:Uncharacterized protein n=1 Tax=Dermacentor silvarum TaxID=543639 RepID=A0ACB8CGW0_DERSI|nr:hypothetical protein HPB49_019727 [Dermacentor silvarum]